MRKAALFLAGSIFLTISALAQSGGPTTRDPEPQSYQRSYQPKKSKKVYNLNAEFDRLVVEYEERMKANVKKYKKMARKMDKPQYSDPMYFGHKRKPKKRKVGKRKFCKECCIVH